MMKWLNILLCIACLSACNVWVLSNKTVSPYERRAEKNLSLDADIQQTIFDTFDDNRSLLQGCHINVDVYNQAVLLTGEVPSNEVKERVIMLVRVITSIKRVYDYLNIASIGNNTDRQTDATLANNMQQTLRKINLSHFHAEAVKVVVSNQVVYLMGLVSRQEGETIIKVVRLQPHIQGVVAIFDYLD